MPERESSADPLAGIRRRAIDESQRRATENAAWQQRTEQQNRAREAVHQFDVTCGRFFAFVNRDPFAPRMPDLSDFLPNMAAALDEVGTHLRGAGLLPDFSADVRALLQAVRAAFMVLPDVTAPDLKYFLPVKTNIMVKPAGLAFTLQGLPEGTLVGRR
jgi:hypothetical protein